MSTATQPWLDQVLSTNNGGNTYLGRIDRAVLLALAYWGSRTTEPTPAQLSTHTGYSTSAVRACLRKLDRHGLVEHDLQVLRWRLTELVP